MGAKYQFAINFNFETFSPFKFRDEYSTKFNWDLSGFVTGFVRILDFSFPGRFLVKYPNNVRGFFSRSFDLVYFLSRVRNVNICAVGKM